ncbi:MAG: ECF-type sigma factor [Rubripirellula sp.]
MKQKLRYTAAANCKRELQTGTALGASGTGMVMGTAHRLDPLAEAPPGTGHERGERAAAEQLFPLVYDELRKLAAARLAYEQRGQTLQATALVHEAYVRLVDQASPQQWDGRGHFFAAAAESMRRILAERARRRKAEKYGGGMARVELSDRDLLSRSDPRRSWP